MRARGEVEPAEEDLPREVEGVPELSVICIFVGKKLRTKATSKTVLFNSNTVLVDLVRQVMQRFRLPAGKDPGNYYFILK